MTWNQTQVRLASKFMLVVVQPFLWCISQNTWQAQPLCYQSSLQCSVVYHLDPRNVMVVDLLRLWLGPAFAYLGCFFLRLSIPFQQSQTALLPRIFSVPVCESYVTFLPNLTCCVDLCIKLSNRIFKIRERVYQVLCWKKTLVIVLSLPLIKYVTWSLDCPGSCVPCL